MADLLLPSSGVMCDLLEPDPDLRKISLTSTASSVASTSSEDSSVASTSEEHSLSGHNTLLALRSSLGSTASINSINSLEAQGEGSSRVGVRCLPLGVEASWVEVWCRQRVGGHPLLQACVGVTHTPTGLQLTLEVPPCGDLSAYLPQGGVGEARAQAVARHVCAALEHVHACGLVHCALKPQHVLVCDRSLSSFKLGGLHALTTQGGTVPARRRVAMDPPEVWARRGAPYTADESQDAWQLGLLLVACLTGSLPWGAARLTDPHYAAWAAWVTHASLTLPAPFTLFSRRFLQLLRRLLHPDPCRRGHVQAVAQCLGHRWLARQRGVMHDTLRTVISTLTNTLDTLTIKKHSNTSINKHSNTSINKHSNTSTKKHSIKNKHQV